MKKTAKILALVAAVLMLATGCKKLPEFKNGESGNGGSTSDVMSLPYLQSFSNNFGTYITKNIIGDQEWIIDYETAKMSGYVQNEQGTYIKYHNEDWLISSPVAITGVEHAKIVMTYIGCYFDNINDGLTILSSKDYQHGEMPGTATWDTVPSSLVGSSNWATWNTAEISLDSYIDETITIAVRYISTNTNAGTIEIKSISIEEGVASGGSGNGEAPTGAINGLFSVSDNKQVYFSKGNLQYQASTNTWRFAENQWDYVGDDNANISSNYSGWIDLFGWGTSGWDSGNTYYHPWDSNNSSGSHYGHLGQCGLTGAYANSDWGVYNPISNGGNTTNTWRTLLKEEWDYVFNTRNTTSGIRYAKAQVNGVNGVVLLPDDWNTVTYSLSNTNDGDAAYSSNIISVMQWDALESAGAVFLPAAGYRFGTSIGDVGSCGYYWSASYFNSSYAYLLSLKAASLSTGNASNRSYGRSVRVVCSAE